MPVEFRKNKTLPDSVVIKGVEVERVETYKYLGLSLIKSYAGKKTPTFGSVCWGGNIPKQDKDILDKIIKNADRVVDKRQDRFEAYYN